MNKEKFEELFGEALEPAESDICEKFSADLCFGLIKNKKIEADFVSYSQKRFPAFEKKITLLFHNYFFTYDFIQKVLETIGKKPFEVAFFKKVINIKIDEDYSIAVTQAILKNTEKEEKYKEEVKMNNMFEFENEVLFKWEYIFEKITKTSDMIL